MGTRSLTKFINEENDKEICVMYRQYDGYPEGHGKELAEFLSGMILVNGIRLDDKRKLANGIGCLTAQVISHFKDGVGNIYIYPADTRDCWEEYTYTIYGNINDEIKIKLFCVYDGRVLFDGYASKYLRWIRNYIRKIKNENE